MPLFEHLFLFTDPIPSDGPENMARDEALFSGIDAPWVRFYQWAQPTVSFGYFTSLEQARKHAGHRPLVRRWTGGGIVEHGPDFTWSVGVPLPWANAKKAADWYVAFHSALASAYGSIGFQVDLWPCRKDSRGDACFTNPVAHDVRGPDQRKWAGGAQRRTRKGLLYQGSAHIPPQVTREEIREALAVTLGDTLDRTTLPILSNEREKYASNEWLQRIL